MEKPEQARANGLSFFAGDAQCGAVASKVREIEIAKWPDGTSDNIFVNFRENIRRNNNVCERSCAC
jgi:hypothetical protein